MSAVKRRLVGGLLALLVLAAGVVFLRGGATPIASYAAPNGRERVDLVGPSRWQQLTVGDADLPGVARIIGDDGAVVATSPLLELSGEGHVHWGADTVQIGSSAYYDRRARRWTVTQ